MIRERGTYHTLDLPAPPSGWMELSHEQLRAVHRLMHSARSVADLKLRVFLMLCGLRAFKRGYHDVEPGEGKGGGVVYHFRRSGWWNRLFGGVAAMASWEVCFWIDRYMGFLDEPLKLLRLPFEYVRIGFRKYKAPDAQMVNLTYEQYGNAQRYLIGCWDAKRALTEDQEMKASERGKLFKEMMRCRAGFLAHLFTPPSLRLLDQRHQSTRFSPQAVYHYDADRAERLIPKFMQADAKDDTLFDICCQFFQSCQIRYKEDFPFLFKDYDGGSDRSALVMEIDTVNAVQKYAGYTSQQEVYDSNSVFIFGFLNNMAHEAKELEKLNQKTK